MRPKLLILAFALAACPSTTTPDAEVDATITVTSVVFEDGAPIPEEFTCDGDDVAPPLTWTGAPDETVTFALTLTDPDAPNSTFTHWLVAGIAGATESLPGEQLPGGAFAGVNDFGDAAYAGPCPPVGDEPHDYVFTVYALSEPSDLEEGFSASALDAVLDQFAIARGTLAGTYGR